MSSAGSGVRLRRLAGGLVLLLAAVLLVARASHTWPFLRVFGLTTGLALGLLLFTVAGLCGWGFLLLDRLLGDWSSWGRRDKPEEEEPGSGRWVDFALAFASGSVGVGLLVGVFSPWLMPTTGLSGGILSLGLLLLALRFSRAPGGIQSPHTGSSEPHLLQPGGSTFPKLLVAAFLAPPILHALVPAVSLDSLVYHLAIPRQYALLGGATELPWNVTSWFPRHASMLYGLVLPFESLGRLAQLLHLSAAVMAMVLLAGLGRRVFGQNGGHPGLWAVVVLLCVPTLNAAAGWAWADWWVLLYVAAAIELGFRARERDRPGGAIIMGLCIGAAVACKYVALPVLALPTLFWPKLRARWAVLATAVAVIPPLPWLVFNLRGTGNPLFPLFSDQGRQLGSYRAGEGLLDRFFWWLGRPELIDENLGLILPVMLILALLIRPPVGTSMRPFLGLAGLYLVAAFVYQPTIRSFSVFILIASLFAGGAIARTLAAVDWRRKALLGGIAILAALDLSQVLYVLEEYRPISAVIGLESPGAYLGSGVPYYRPFKVIEANTGENARVLVVGESRIFHLRRPAIAASFLDPHPIRHFRAGCETTECVAAALRAARVSMIYIDSDRIRVVADNAPPRAVIDETSFEVSAEDHGVFSEILEHHAHEVWRERSVALYRLVEEPSGGPSTTGPRAREGSDSAPGR